MTEDKSLKEEQVVEEEKTEESTAKAGKRSAKAVKEAEEKADKEARKAVGDTSPQSEEAEAKAKGPVPVTRPRIERRGKAYRKAAEKVDSNKTYSLEEAIKLATETSVSKFDSTVEMHFRLGVDPKQADQNIRTTVVLPNGTGKKVAVAVFAPADKHQEAKDAGADIVAEDEFLAQLEKEQLNFDVLISVPQFMPKLGKFARLLGPRGLMPNPKSGTITTNIAKAVKEAKGGRVEYRVDKQSIVHQAIGKVSFDQKQLLENAKAFIDSLNSVKPASLKGSYIKSVSMTTTMGPGIKIDLSSL